MMAVKKRMEISKNFFMVRCFKVTADCHLFDVNKMSGLCGSLGRGHKRAERRSGVVST